MLNYIYFNNHKIRFTKYFSCKHIFNTKDVYLALNIKDGKNILSSIDALTLVDLCLRTNSNHNALYDIFDKYEIDYVGSVDIYPMLDENWSDLSSHKD